VPLAYVIHELIDRHCRRIDVPEHKAQNSRDYRGDRRARILDVVAKIH
jgi:hypothetical protein